jgi:hypothetical protein
LFVEFILTNIGLGDRNAAVFGHVVPPEGKRVGLVMAAQKSTGPCRLNRLRMEVGTSLLDMHAPAYKVQVTKRSVCLELQITPDTPHCGQILSRLLAMPSTFSLLPLRLKEPCGERHVGPDSRPWDYEP